MIKEDWYRDRIVWRANRSKLFEMRCVEFSSLPQVSAALILKEVSEPFDPVLVFFKNDCTWTILETSSIYSHYDGNLIRVPLDIICKKISLAGVEHYTTPRELKTKANFLKIKATGDLIWAPEGEELFALWNILRMFPLKVPV
jgi:hypothetical protein